jgi:hypothetical protein
LPIFIRLRVDPIGGSQFPIKEPSGDTPPAERNSPAHFDARADGHAAPDGYPSADEYVYPGTDGHLGSARGG